jgi:polyprenyl-phospho-N-acetylgalactosaminyl synthase
MTAPRVCAIVPTYDNPLTIGNVVRQLLSHDIPVLVIDDGSHEPGRTAVAALSLLPGARCLHRAQNGGKGAAVQDGLMWARELGFTHALQVDADGQHDLSQVPRFLSEASEEPLALVLGYPVFDDSVPRSRRTGRKISVFWCTVETLSRKIRDPLCGFRVYPLEACRHLPAMGKRMDFDVEIAVRLVWAGVPVRNLPVRVVYLDASAGGVSHFRLFKDNVSISWAHTRLVTEGIFRLLAWPWKRIFSLTTGQRG